MNTAEIKQLYDQYVVPTYAPSIALVRGEGCHVWDPEGNRYLDFTGGIAVSSLGHGHPALVRAISEQAASLIHVSNLFFNEWQPRLAQKIVRHLGPGKCFFSNSGAEANEALIKLARKFGAGRPLGEPRRTEESAGKSQIIEAGRYEVISMQNSFHGRTLGTMAATGQEKICKGFEPMPEGFKQVPYNDLEAVKHATGGKTAAVLVECIQGEGGVRAASMEFIRGLREWCDQNKLLLFCDSIQSGVGRTGKFCSFQHYGVEMDGVSLAKSLGGGFPIGAVWIRQPYADVFSVGSHATTFGGSPLAARAALTVLEVIDRENLIDHAARMGEHLAAGLNRLRETCPKIVKEIRGKGLMIGVELHEEHKPWIKKLSAAGLLVVPTGTHVLRLLPPLIIGKTDADEAISILRDVFSTAT